MKSQLRVLAVTVGLFCAATAFAQTSQPAAKPGAAAAPAVVAPVAKESAPPAAQAPTTRKAKTGAAAASKTETPAAAGGGNGKVWVNTNSKAYHCEGSKYYGKTKAGEYMTEADAKAKGFHADHGKACSK